MSLLDLPSSRYGRERGVCFTLIMFLLSYGYYFSVSLHHGALSWSVIVAFLSYTHFLLQPVNDSLMFHIRYHILAFKNDK